MEALNQLKQMIEEDNLKDGDYVIIMYKVDCGKTTVENVYLFNFLNINLKYL